MTHEETTGLPGLAPNGGSPESSLVPDTDDREPQTSTRDLTVSLGATPNPTDSLLM